MRTETVAAAAQERDEKGAARGGWRGALVAAAWAAAGLATRLPWAGRSWGEADCARYLLGAGQWLRAGAAAPLVYAKALSPGYYALLARLAGGGGEAAAARWGVGLSVAAAAASAPLLYRLGRRWADGAVGAAAAGLFLLAPGFWWLGLEAHPQGLSFLCWLGSVSCFAAGLDRRRRLGWQVAAGALLAAGLLLKNDLVLLAGVYPALAWRAGGGWRGVAEGSAVAAGGGVGFALLRDGILGLGMGAGERLTNRAVAQFWGLPRGGGEWIKQLLPVVTGAGAATLAVTLAGLGLGVRRAAWRRRWGWLVMAWAGPGTVFWLLIRGNNARHMAPYLLATLLAGLDGWRGWMAERGWGRAGWGVAAVAVLAAGLNAGLAPASSNVALYPSANVPGSARDLAARQAEMGAWLEATRARAEAAGDGRPCYVGNATLPYLELAAVERGGRLGTLAWRATAAPAAARVALEGSELRFVETNSAAEYRAAAAACATVWSLEYGPGGAKRRFLGGEWAGAGRFYPGKAK